MAETIPWNRFLGSFKFYKFGLWLVAEGNLREGGLTRLIGIGFKPEPEFKLLRSPGIDSKEWITPAYEAWRDGMTTLFAVPARQATEAGGMDSLESIPGLLKSLQFKLRNGVAAAGMSCTDPVI
jgi:hypothetical protein